MSNAFGLPQQISFGSKNVSGREFNIQLPHLDLVLTCERVTSRPEGELVLIVRSLSGGPIKLLPSASNTVGITSVDNYSETS